MGQTGLFALSDFLDGPNLRINQRGETAQQELVHMQPILLVIQFLLAVALVGVILLQRSAQDGGGLMGGGSTMGGLFTARGSANLLTRTTAILATLFILNSLALGYIASSQHRTSNLIEQILPDTPASQTVPASPADSDTSGTTEKAPATTSITPPKAPEVPVAH